ncbi:hypothetical protein [Priestia aryabhattai]
MEPKRRADKHNKKKLGKVVKVNFNKKLEVSKDNIKRLPALKSKVESGLKSINKRGKKDIIIEDDKQFSKLITKLSKTKKTPQNLKEVVSSISNFNGLAKSYLETIKTITNSNEKTVNSAIELLREQSNGLLVYLNKNAEIMSPEERIKIIDQLAEITNKVYDIEKDNKIFLKHLKKASGMALVAAFSLLMLILQSQSNNDDNNIIDMDDIN